MSPLSRNILASCTLIWETVLANDYEAGVSERKERGKNEEALDLFPRVELDKLDG
jgi:hypothetical protein